MSIIQLSAADLAAKLAAREVSSVEATQAHLDRIAAVDGDVHAFLHISTDAIATAARIDERRTAGEALGPLAGVPIAIKDVLCTIDMPTTAGSRILEGWVPPYDATVVARLRAAKTGTMMSDISGSAAISRSIASPGTCSTRAVLAQRIVQLGGEPDFSPDTLSGRSHAEYDDSLDLKAMIRTNLIAERVAIETYSQLITLIGDKDSTTRRLLEDILSDEQEHADELSDWLTE